MLDDQITDALWPDELPGHPGQALRTSVSRLRRTLGMPDAIERDGGGYRLVVGPGAVDADRFEALLTRADDGDRVARLRRALDLWTSDVAYADFRYDDFVQAEAERLQSHRLRAYDDLFTELLASGESRELIPDLQLLAREHPHRESFYRFLMLAQYRAGQQAEALKTFQVARARLRDELGIDPSQALSDLEKQILAQDAWLDRSPLAPPNNIPNRLASIVGREAEIEQLAQHLQDWRLVTATGPVGVGKSTVVIESARRIVSEGQMECWYLDLAGVETEDQIPAWIADRLAGLLHGETGRSSEAFTPGRLIGTKRMLIVLDNCEHVIDGVGMAAATILKECPNVAILSASRERLGLPGEFVYPITPLLVSADEPEILDPEQAVGRFPALQLFSDRVQTASPGYRWSSADVPIALRLCHKLDGLPLAIELAAARVGSLAIAEIERQVDGYHAILSPQGGVEPRHRSLEAAIAWSYDLLDEHQQECLEVLARVHGPFSTMDAARLFDIDDESRAAAMVASLRDKSLLRTDPAMSPRHRFSMLRTIREFGMARAAEAGKAREHKIRHARCFLALAGQAEEHLRGGPNQLEWLARCEQSTLDFLAAVTTFIEEDHVEEALDVVARVGIVWTQLRHHATAYPTIRDALAASGAAVFDSTPRVHVVAAFIDLDQPGHEFRDGSDHAGQALRTARIVGDTESAINATALVGLHQWLAGQGDEARESVTAACRLAEGEAGWAEAFACTIAGIVEHALRPSGGAIVALERAAALALARSDEALTAAAFSFLGAALKDLGHHPEARAAFRTAYESGQRIGDPEPAIRGAAGLALASSLDADTAEAAEASGRALRLLGPLSTGVRYAGLSSLYLGYEVPFDIDTLDEAMTRVLRQPRSEQPTAFIRFLLEMAERRAVDVLDPARVEEIQAALTALESPPDRASA